MERNVIYYINIVVFTEINYLAVAAVVAVKYGARVYYSSATDIQSNYIKSNASTLNPPPLLAVV